MAKQTTSKTPKSKIYDLPVAGVMLHARAIIEQGRTMEFIKACEKQEFSMRARRDFVMFAREFIASEPEQPAGLAAVERKFTAASKKKFDDTTGCK